MNSADVVNSLLRGEVAISADDEGRSIQIKIKNNRLVYLFEDEPNDCFTGMFFSGFLERTRLIVSAQDAEIRHKGKKTVEVDLTELTALKEQVKVYLSRIEELERGV